jgi:hypothetical protein
LLTRHIYVSITNGQINRGVDSVQGDFSLPTPVSTSSRPGSWGTGLRSGRHTASTSGRRDPMSVVPDPGPSHRVPSATEPPVAHVQIFAVFAAGV